MNEPQLLERPFEILKLIRDGEIESLADLGVDMGRSPSSYAIPAESLLAALCTLGWVTMKLDGRLETTQRLAEVQKLLRLSLTRLAPYGAEAVVANPLFGPPTAPPIPAEVFVLMPFAEELKPVYQDHIKTVSERLSVTAIRADDFFAANSIVADVWNAINHARVLIADCTHRNPNVFYELGMAHTLGKPVILIAQDRDDIPFDVRHMRTILYDFTPRGMREFEATLEQTLSHELGKPQSLRELVNLVKSGAR